MTEEHVQRGGSRRASQSHTTASHAPAGERRDRSQTQGQRDTRAQADDLDAVIGDIETTLQTNAEEYVNSFVQKGGE